MKARLFKLPGFISTFRTDHPIIPGGNFTWGEALHWNGETLRIPKTKEHVVNILKLATMLQRFRDEIKKPIRVISWYRPDPWNEQAGGVSNSQHKYGTAVDIQVLGYSGRQLKEVAKKINWIGGIGVYPKPREKSLHLDIGKPREWDDA